MAGRPISGEDDEEPAVTMGERPFVKFELEVPDTVELKIVINGVEMLIDE